LKSAAPRAGAAITSSGAGLRRSADPAAMVSIAFAAQRALGILGRLLSWPLLALLWLYRRFISPVLPPSCRYYPSCSQYAQEAISLHGPVRGVWLAGRRLLRCHPYCEGGPDPVPPRLSPRRSLSRSV
jgi:putative membrane protein insertion efficiency factor